MTSEIVLDREEVATISERTLSHKAHFGETVEHHATGLHALNSINNFAWSSREAQGRRNRGGSVAVPRPVGFRVG
jgi:hypothetical protein